MNEICDRCNARALTAWIKGSTADEDALMLTLCGHHARSAESGLLAAGFELIVDHREVVKV